MAAYIGVEFVQFVPVASRVRSTSMGLCAKMSARTVTMVTGRVIKFSGKCTTTLPVRRVAIPMVITARLEKSGSLQCVGLSAGV